MFRGLFGSSNNQSPAPPKNQIEVVCPVCGAAQYEPRLVVSTFCKRCGVHLKKDGKRVIASDVSKAGGQPDALQPRQAGADQPSASPRTAPLTRANVVPGPRPLTGPLTSMTAASNSGRVQVPVYAPEATDEPGEVLGLGAMIQAAASATTPQPPQSKPAQEIEAPEVVPPSTNLASPVPTPVQPEFELEPTVIGDATVKIADNVPVSIAEIMQTPASSGSNTGTLQKMRDQGMYRNHNFKEAQCFECDHKFKVGRSSRSANCPTCGAYISMEDVELNMPSTQAIKTRGDVLIRKRGHLTAPNLYARDLRCFGLITANTQCAGDAIFKTSGKIIGEIRCRKFIVEKGSEIEFMNEVHADEIEINATVKGHFFSKGKLVILANGNVDGSVSGRSISIEPGGELNGAMNIVRGTPA